ncbi:Calcium-dependent lipid-binding family protein isoform 1 [Gossypium australe]|uniref:Calcium-dependent lipid-binding family protein isoform 1 n=1 Tax=Gossypium australe TaxID=47621 RepID=A0A5B6WXP1_9ROSI|nr:Calcium-dependent lipid-binding family protein isoform 1 [Gossypium australe]
MRLLEEDEHQEVKIRRDRTKLTLLKSLLHSKPTNNYGTTHPNELVSDNEQFSHIDIRARAPRFHLTMDSPQPVVSPLKNTVIAESGEKQKSNTKEAVLSNKDNNILGVLEVYVHQARDIHIICIYHKQDVYAKLCLTTDPETTVSTKIINGGGSNPVFNDNLRLDVGNIDSCLKIEIFMMSRVKNYLDDQLLGFALVPLSEVLLKNGKLEEEFSLSSTDIFRSPAGFVQLSLEYIGSSPDVMTIPNIVVDETVKDSETDELEKIEFPDPKIINKNHMMVSEYFGISCSNLDSENSEMGVNVLDSIQVPKLDSPPSSVSTNGVSLSKEKTVDVGDGDSNLSGAKLVVSVNIEPEMKVVQQDIVDMYMKSMQQFTESLAQKT